MRGLATSAAYKYKIAAPWPEICCNASAAADGVPPLLILDAEVELASTRGRRSLPLGKFITGNRRTMIARDEIMSAILIPRPGTAG
jgi:CO/xanthine dehydrogenase FAD-binding subunit